MFGLVLGFMIWLPTLPLKRVFFRARRGLGLVWASLLSVEALKVFICSYLHKVGVGSGFTGFVVLSIGLFILALLPLLRKKNRAALSRSNIRALLLARALSSTFTLKTLLLKVKLGLCALGLWAHPLLGLARLAYARLTRNRKFFQSARTLGWSRSLASSRRFLRKHYRSRP